MLRDSLYVTRFLIVTMNKRPQVLKKKISFNELKVGKNVTSVFTLNFFNIIFERKGNTPS